MVFTWKEKAEGHEKNMYVCVWAGGEGWVGSLTFR